MVLRISARTAIRKVARTIIRGLCLTESCAARYREFFCAPPRQSLEFGRSSSAFLLFPEVRLQEGGGRGAAVAFPHLAGRGVDFEGMIFRHDELEAPAGSALRRRRADREHEQGGECCPKEQAFNVEFVVHGFAEVCG